MQNHEIERGERMLSVLSELTGDTTQNIWTSIVNSNYFEAWTALLVSFAFSVIFMAILFVFMRRILSKSVSHYEWEEAVAIVSGTILFFLIVTFSACLVDCVPVIMNPEYYAIKEIANAEIL